MSAPKPNITLADGTTRYLPPDGRAELKNVLQTGSNGHFNQRDTTFRRLEQFGLIEGVQTRLSGQWRWTLTEHGKVVAQALTDQIR
jgi:hypothetical protein